jgi:hypothetical protein
MAKEKTAFVKRRNDLAVPECRRGATGKQCEAKRKLLVGHFFIELRLFGKENTNRRIFISSFCWKYTNGTIYYSY